MNKLISLTLTFASLMTLGSCYYDIEEELYPAYNSNDCDTSNVGYTKDIEPLLRNACYTCHGAGINLGNVTLEGYGSLQPYIADGSLIGSVEHNSEFSPMPKGGTKLSDCNIKKMQVWINEGAINN